MHRLFLLISVISVNHGCGSSGFRTYYPEQKATNEACKEIFDTSSAASKRHMTFGILTSLAATTAAVFIPLVEDDFGVAGLSATSAGFASVATYLFTRSSAASEAAGATLAAQVEADPRTRFDKCMMAFSGWESSRAASQFASELSKSKDAAVLVIRSEYKATLAEELASIEVAIRSGGDMANESLLKRKAVLEERLRKLSAEEAP